MTYHKFIWRTSSYNYITFTYDLSVNRIHVNQYREIFMVAPCINNIKHFIVQLMHSIV